MFTCKILLITIYLTLVMFCHSAIAKHSKTLKQMSDTLCVLTPAVALTASVFKEEPEKSGVYLLQLLSQEAFVEGAKNLFPTPPWVCVPAIKEKMRVLVL